MKKRLIIISTCLLAIFSSVIILAATSAQIIDARFSTLADRTRVVFDLSAPVEFHAFILKNPERLVIDLSDVTVTPKVKQQEINNNLIQAVRYGYTAPEKARVVFDLKQAATFNIFKLKADTPQPDRLVIDILANETSATSIAVNYSHELSSKPTHELSRKPILVPQLPINSHAKTTEKIVSKKPEKLRDVIIVIDPGHGGKDPGATGIHGTHEKNVVFAISKDLQKMLNNDYGFKAYLTRTGDYFIPLRGRLAIERHYHPDMFVAIHADAYKNTEARGASVFALSQNGATSEAARWLAVKENESELGNTLSNLQYQSPMLRSLLINLAQNASISASLSIGDDIMRELRHVTPLHQGFVEQAGFMVLKEPDVPSLLVETGFLSNADEELELRDPVHQEQIAHALMEGIKTYFTSHPPQNTFLMKNKT